MLQLKPILFNLRDRSIKLNFRFLLSSLSTGRSDNNLRNCQHAVCFPVAASPNQRRSVLFRCYDSSDQMPAIIAPRLRTADRGVRIEGVLNPLAPAQRSNGSILKHGLPASSYSARSILRRFQPVRPYPYASGLSVPVDRNSAACATRILVRADATDSWAAR